MISAIIKNDFIWGAFASFALDAITKTALKALYNGDSLYLRGLASTLINMAVYIKTGRDSPTLPGIAWGFFLMVEGILRRQKELDKLEEEIYERVEKLGFVEAELQQRKENIRAMEANIRGLERELKYRTLLEGEIQKAIAQLNQS